MKKNILAAILAVITTSAIFVGSCPTTSAAPNTNAELVEETEPMLGPPICLLGPEEIPDQAWEAISQVMDFDGDGIIRVNDAIKANKDDRHALSQKICQFIIDEGCTDGITMSPVSLQELTSCIRSEQSQLINIWAADTDENSKNDTARCLLFNNTTASFFVYEVGFVTEEKGFVLLWDYDKDKQITEKDAASVYLNEEDETKAITISTYAQYGDGAFAISADATSDYCQILEQRLEDGHDLIAVGENNVATFNYDGGIHELYY